MKFYENKTLSKGLISKFFVVLILLSLVMVATNSISQPQVTQKTHQNFKTPYERVKNEKVVLGRAAVQSVTSEKINIKEMSTTSVLQTTSYINHNPIIIDGNSDFINKATSEKWQGNGSSTDPYIIQNYFIDATTGDDIDISNTNLYFIIQNVWVNGTLPNNNGIYLYNVTNGVLKGNIASNNSIGFFIKSSTKNNLSNNFATENKYGFSTYQSTYIVLTNNTANNNNQFGFFLNYQSRHNILFNNTANNNLESGFYFYSDASSNNIYNNTASNNGYGFHLYSYSNGNIFTNNSANSNNYYGFFLNIDCTQNNLTNNFASSNLQNGFYFSSGSSSNKLFNNTADNNGNNGYSLTNTIRFTTLINNIATNNNQSGFYLSTTANNNTLRDNIANYNGFTGFNLSTNSNFNILDDNTAFRNVLNGFYLYSGSDYNIMSNNGATENMLNGMYLVSGSNYNTLTNNTVKNNLQNGLYLSGSTSNILCINIVTGNLYGIVIDQSITGLTSIIGNTLIANSAGNAVDNSSLNLWYANIYDDYYNSGQYVIPGRSGAIDKAPKALDSDSDGIPDWWEKEYNLNPFVNDANLDPDDDGITNLQEFIGGTNPNVSNLHLSPIVISIKINDSIVWKVASENPLNYTIYSNGSVVKKGDWISGQEIAYYIKNLAPNNYKITIILFDTHGQSTANTIFISIAGQTTTSYSASSTSSMSSTSSGKSSPGFEFLTVLFLPIVLLIFPRKKK